MSLRTKVLLWIITVNLAITALLLSAIFSSVGTQREEQRRTLAKIRENREEVIERFSNILLFEESLARLEEQDITPLSIIHWEEWENFDDALVLKNYVELEGEIIYTDIELNPLGSRQRSPSFDRAAALQMLKRAIAEDRRVTEGDAIAIPIHVRPSQSNGSQGAVAQPLAAGNNSKVWGAAFVRPRFPRIAERVDFFDLTVFWIAMGGGTLVLIVATYVILSTLVIRPVEEMASVADRVASGDFSVQCAGSGSQDEVGRLIRSFNFMVNEVGDFHRHLQERLAEVRRRVQLAERHLKVAQGLASTGKLAAGIAHEINNPLGGMINAAIRLKENAEPGSRDDLYLGLIIEGLERIKITVRNLLAFTPRKMEPQPTAVVAVLEDALALIAHKIKRQEIEVTLAVNPPGLRFICEAGEIRQVFLNILINAVDAIEDRGGTIEITGFHDLVENTAIVEVRDNGCGMSEELLNNAFEPFYSTKPSGDGTGLGLSIAHNIITNHGGRIEAQSALGGGTSIRITLPAS